jgi:sugar/nucleoside kinase (ribokinase family)
MDGPAAVLGRVEELVALSDVVKASDEDIAWLYPDVPVETALRRWVDLGPALAVCTRGPLGAYAVLRTSRDHLVVPQNTVTLADTVGAGDSFMAGLVSGLTDAGLLGGPVQRGVSRPPPGRSSRPPCTARWSRARSRSATRARTHRRSRRYAPWSPRTPYLA